MGYHPTLGRFLQRDPDGYVDGMNLQEYCRSRPTMLTDPSGLNAVSFTDDPKTHRRMEYMGAWVDEWWMWLTGHRRVARFPVAQRVKTDAVDGWLVPTAGIEWTHRGLTHEFKYDIVVKDREKLKSLLLANPAPTFRRPEEALLHVIAFHRKELGDMTYVDRQGAIVDMDKVDLAERAFHEGACSSAREMATQNLLPALATQALVNWLVGHASALLAQVNALQLTRPNSSFAGVLDTQVSIRAALAKQTATRGQTARLAARLSEYHMALKHNKAKDCRTTAILQTNRGVIIGSGKTDLNPSQRALLRPGEILARMARTDAEITVVTKAQQLGLAPKELIATRRFCDRCREFLLKTGAEIVGPQRAIWPD